MRALRLATPVAGIHCIIRHPTPHIFLFSMVRFIQTPSVVPYQSTLSIVALLHLLWMLWIKTKLFHFGFSPRDFPNIHNKYNIHNRLFILPRILKPVLGYPRASPYTCCPALDTILHNNKQHKWSYWWGWGGHGSDHVLCPSPLSYSVPCRSMCSPVLP